MPHSTERHNKQQTTNSAVTDHTSRGETCPCKHQTSQNGICSTAQKCATNNKTTQSHITTRNVTVSRVMHPTRDTQTDTAPRGTTNDTQRKSHITQAKHVLCNITHHASHHHIHSTERRNKHTHHASRHDTHSTERHNKQQTTHAHAPRNDTHTARRGVKQTTHAHASRHHTAKTKCPCSNERDASHHTAHTAHDTTRHAKHGKHGTERPNETLTTSTEHYGATTASTYQGITLYKHVHLHAHQKVGSKLLERRKNNEKKIYPREQTSDTSGVSSFSAR